MRSSVSFNCSCVIILIYKFSANFAIFRHICKFRIISLAFRLKVSTFAIENAVVAQLVEHQLPKLRVASSSLVYRSNSQAGR